MQDDDDDRAVVRFSIDDDATGQRLRSRLSSSIERGRHLSTGRDDGRAQFADSVNPFDGITSADSRDVSQNSEDDALGGRLRTRMSASIERGRSQTTVEVLSKPAPSSMLAKAATLFRSGKGKPNEPPTVVATAAANPLRRPTIARREDAPEAAVGPTGSTAPTTGPEAAVDPHILTEYERMMAATEAFQREMGSRGASMFRDESSLRAPDDRDECLPSPSQASKDEYRRLAEATEAFQRQARTLWGQSLARGVSEVPNQTRYFCSPFHL